VLFDSSIIGSIAPASGWTSEYLPWEEGNKHIKRELQPHTGYELLQGKGIARGCLIGGCIEVLEMLKGTELWPDKDEWKDTILFFETSEDKPDPAYFEYWLRNYGSQGILGRTNGIIFSKPYDNKYYDDYKKAIIKVVRNELKLTDMPILCNMNFGHTAPMMILPYGAMAEIDSDHITFSILESGVE
jgi:muramoyltetrapeptide carboxypeptidase LdcA involved in peptidoglycan recycling